MTRVLIVEDEQHLAQGLRFNLEAEGYSVEVSETGESGLEILRTQPFNLVVLDVMLPGKSGFTVASELRAAQQPRPCLTAAELATFSPPNPYASLKENR